MAIKVSPSGLAMKEAAEQWRSFMQWIDGRAASNWLFRGHGNQAFTLMPKIGRIPSAAGGTTTAAHTLATRVDAERRLLASFKRRCHLFDDGRPKSDWGWLSLAQHHGMPTRLLDWTSNPLIACFFCVTTEPDHDGEIRAISVTKLPKLDLRQSPDPFDFGADIGLVSPVVTTPRLSAQRGYFSAHPDPYSPWAVPAGRSFAVKRTLKPFFQRRLHYIGVDAAHIYGDLDALCRTLEWQYARNIGFGPNAL